MTITLAQAKVGMANKVDQQIVDSFRRGSAMLDLMLFDDTVSPGTGGSTLVYGYERLLTPSSAAFRALNNEYIANEAIKQALTTQLRIFGGTYTLDRVVIDTAGAADEMSFQAEQKIKAATNLWHWTVINGNNGVNPNEFDGLDVALVGSVTEANAAAVIDLSTSALIDANFVSFLDELENWLATLDGKPSMIAGSSRLITKIKQVARRAGYLTHSEDAFGRTVSGYDGIPLIDLENHVTAGGALVPCVPIFNNRAPGGVPAVGLTDLYALRLGLDGFHGATVTGDKIIRSYLPDLNAPGAVKTGEVEMIGAPILKSTRAAGVLRNIKIQ